MGISVNPLALSVHSLAHAKTASRVSMSLEDAAASPAAVQAGGPINSPTVLTDGVPLSGTVGAFVYQYYTIDYTVPFDSVEVTVNPVFGDPGWCMRTHESEKRSERRRMACAIAQGAEPPWSTASFPRYLIAIVAPPLTHATDLLIKVNGGPANYSNFDYSSTSWFGADSISIRYVFTCNIIC